jgi:hypothetical protein
MNILICIVLLNNELYGKCWSKCCKARLAKRGKFLMCSEHVPNVPFVKQGFLGNIFDGKNVGNISVVFK